MKTKRPADMQSRITRLLLWCLFVALLGALIPYTSPSTWSSDALTVNSEMTTYVNQNGVRTKLRTMTWTASESGSSGTYRIGDRALKIKVSPPRYLYNVDIVARGPKHVQPYLASSYISSNPTAAQDAIENAVSATSQIQFASLGVLDDTNTNLTTSSRRLRFFDLALGAAALGIAIHCEQRLNVVENRLDDAQTDIKDLYSITKGIDGNVSLLQSQTAALTQQTIDLSNQVTGLGDALGKTNDAVAIVNRQLSNTVDQLKQTRDDTKALTNALQSQIINVQNQMAASAAQFSNQLQAAMNTVFGQIQSVADKQRTDSDMLMSLIEAAIDSVDDTTFLVRQEFNNPTMRHALSVMFHAIRSGVDPLKFFTVARDIGQQPASITGDELTGTDSRIAAETVYFMWSAPTGGSNPPFVSNSKKFQFFLNSNYAPSMYNAGAKIRSHIAKLGPTGCVPPVLSDGFPAVINTTSSYCYFWIEVREAACGTSSNIAWNTRRPYVDGMDGLFSSGGCSGSSLLTNQRAVIRSEAEFDAYMTQFCRGLGIQSNTSDNGIMLSLAMGNSQRLVNTPSDWCDMTYRSILNERERKTPKPTVDVKSAMLSLLEQVMKKLAIPVATADVKRYGTLPSSMEIQWMPLTSPSAAVDPLTGLSQIDAQALTESAYVARWIDATFETLPVVSITPGEPFFSQRVDVSWNDTGEAIISADVLSTVPASPLLPKSTLMVGHPADIPTDLMLYDMPDGSISVSPRIEQRINRYPYMLFPKDVTTTPGYSYFFNKYGLDFQPGRDGRVSPQYSAVPVTKDVSGSPYCVTDYKSVYSGDFDFGPASNSIVARCTSHGTYVSNLPNAFVPPAGTTNYFFNMSMLAPSLVSSAAAVPGFASLDAGFWYTGSAVSASTSPIRQSLCNATSSGSSSSLDMGVDTNGYPYLVVDGWDFDQDSAASILRAQFAPINDNTPHLVLWSFTPSGALSLRIDDVLVATLTGSPSLWASLSNTNSVSCYSVQLAFLFVATSLATGNPAMYAAPAAPETSPAAATTPQAFAFFTPQTYAYAVTLQMSQPRCTGYQSPTATLSTLTHYRIRGSVPGCTNVGTSREDVTDVAYYGTGNMYARPRPGLLSSPNAPGAIGFYLARGDVLENMFVYSCDSTFVAPSAVAATTSTLTQYNCWRISFQLTNQVVQMSYTNYAPTTPTTVSLGQRTFSSVGSVHYMTVVIISGTVTVYGDGISLVSRSIPTYTASPMREVYMHRWTDASYTRASPSNLAAWVMRPASVVFAYPSGSNNVLSSATAVRNEHLCLHSKHAAPLFPAGHFAQCRATLNGANPRILSCRSQTYCGGRCTIYGTTVNVTATSTQLNVVSRECDPGYTGTMCDTRCARVHPVTGECVVAVGYNETLYGSGEIPSGTWCPLLKYFKMTTDSSGRSMYLEPRQWDIGFTISVPAVGDLDMDVAGGTNLCPSVKKQSLLNGRQQIIMRNDVAQSTNLRVRLTYAPNVTVSADGSTPPPPGDECTGARDVSIAPDEDLIIMLPLCGLLDVRVLQVDQVTGAPTSECQALSAFSSEAPMSTRLDTAVSSDTINAVLVSTSVTSTALNVLAQWMATRLELILNATGVQADDLRASFAADAARFSNLSSYLANFSTFADLYTPLNFSVESDVSFQAFLNTSAGNAEAVTMLTNSVTAQLASMRNDTEMIVLQLLDIAFNLTKYTSSWHPQPVRPPYSGPGSLSIGDAFNAIGQVFEGVADVAATAAKAVVNGAVDVAKTVTRGVFDVIGDFFGVSGSVMSSIFSIVVVFVALYVLYLAYSNGVFDSCFKKDKDAKESDVEGDAPVPGRRQTPQRPLEPRNSDNTPEAGQDAAPLLQQKRSIILGGGASRKRRPLNA